MLWIVSCVTKPNIEEIRAMTHEAEVIYRESKLSEGVLAFAGPLLGDDGKTVIGSILMMDASSADEVRALSEAAPFAQAGMFESMTICRTKMGRWNADALARALGSR